MESLVRQSIGKTTGNIYKSEVDKITYLKLGSSYTELTLSELAKITNLYGLTIEYTNTSDISPLSNLSKLSTLGLSNNQISDISALSELTTLTYLYLSNNQIWDISALSKLSKLAYLNLYSNLINNEYTPNAVHKTELDFTVGGITYEVWVVEKPEEEPVELSKGDLDGNGYFNSLDFALMRAYLIGKVKDLTERQLECADVNSDGYVDSLDFAIMRQVIVGKRPGFN